MAPRQASPDPDYDPAVMLNLWLHRPADGIHDRLAQLSGFVSTPIEPAYSHMPRTRSDESRSGASSSLSTANTLVHQPHASIPSTASTLVPDPDTSTLSDSVSTPRPLYECLFWFLPCPYLSGNSSEWRTHSLAHLHGADPPQSVSCPLCPWTELRARAGEAWTLRTQHLERHFQAGEKLSGTPPDKQLSAFLWRNKLIADHVYKELKAGNQSSMRAPTTFVTTGRARSRRDQPPRGYRVQQVGPDRS